ncbi:MAG: hypothetical protein IPG44_03695 [Anaerolineales bacterium]|nr:hypothetical protein [Anaerolineales bacterium]
MKTFNSSAAWSGIAPAVSPRGLNTPAHKARRMSKASAKRGKRVRWGMRRLGRGIGLM